MTPRRALRNVEDVYPLTPTQQGMLFHTISSPGSGVYVDQITGRLGAALDVDAYRSAWDAVVARHEALRAAFVWDGVDEPLQVVRRHVELPWIEPPWAGEWSRLNPSERSRRLAELLSTDRARGFDVADAPLMRMHLWADDAGWQLLWSFHHLIADGWSVRTILQEVKAIHDAGSTDRAGLDEPMRFRDHVEHLATQDWSPAEDHWRQELGDVSGRTALAQPVPPTPGSGVRQASRSLSEAATARLRSVAARERITINTVVQGAWAIVLARWAHDRDVVFGVTGSGRISGLAGVERAVGLFINTVPLRARLDPERPVGDWLRALQRDRLDLGDLELTPLASVQQWSGVAPGEPLFDSVLVFENYPSGPGSLDGPAGLSDIGHHEQSNYPLAVLALPGDRLELTLVYDRACYGEGWIDIVLRQLCLAIERIGDHADATLGGLDLVADDDRARLREWNDPARHGTASTDPGVPAIHDLVEAVAAQEPAAVAVVADGCDPLTYAELDRRANGLAHRLRADGVEPGDRVALEIVRSPEMIVGILGILKAGAAYVPLDPAYPEARNRALADDAGVSAVVSGQLPAGAATPPPVTRDGDLPAYVIYTSGSTGQPKGVEVSHRNLVHSTTARSHHYGAGPDRFVLVSSFAFDSSMVGIFWTLCTGGTLVLPAAGDEHDVDRLGDLIARHEATHVLMLPSLYSLLLEHAGARLGSLRVAIVAGEACLATAVERHLALQPGTELHNEYGPTEATVWCTVARLGPDDCSDPVPIGRPIANTSAHVLDAQRRSVPVGFPGELYVGGEGVATGYHGRPDLTAERFVTVDPDGDGPQRLYRTGDLVAQRRDGALLYLGRVDSQVKVRGHRIETSEVETVLAGVDGVIEAVVIGYEIARGRNQLVAFVVSEGTDEDRVRAHLRDRLPEFMVPGRIVVLPAVPRLANGKVDVRALHQELAARPATDRRVAPRTDSERTLAALWSELLDVDDVGAHDDFFELGGDSIVSIQLISRARHAGLHLEPRDIAANPTLGALAARAGTSVPVAPDDSGAGAVPLGPIQRWFLDLDLAHPHHWNQSQLFELTSDVDQGALTAALRACVAHHGQLRARFRHDTGGWRQTIPEGPEPALTATEVANERSLFDVQSGFDLAVGPPIAASFLRRGDGEPDLLLIAVHHLVIDVVSWSILVEDFEAAYHQALAGSPIVLPAPTTSYGRWAEQAPEPIEPAASSATSVPTDFDGEGFGTEATTRTMSVSLSPEQTGSLLDEANAAYRTTVEDLLATALVVAMGEWTGTPGLELGLERHGRPDDPDVSRTVGWFTSVRAADLEVPAGAEPGEAIMAVKEQIRAASTSPPRMASVALNYLGRTDRARTDRASTDRGGSVGFLRPVLGANASSRYPANERVHLIEIVAAVRDSRLVVDWQYSDERHRTPTIERVAESFANALARLIEWCRNPDAGGFTPSDFPEAGLDQDELDAFLDGIL